MVPPPKEAVFRGLYLSELLPGVGPSPEVRFVLAKSDCHQCVATVIKYGPVVLRRERVEIKSVCLHVELLAGSSELPMCPGRYQPIL